LGVVVRFKAVEWAEHLDALASQEGGNTGTSDAIRSSEYDRVVEEHQLEKILGMVRWDGKRGEQGKLFMDLWFWDRVRVEFCRSGRSCFLGQVV